MELLLQETFPPKFSLSHLPICCLTSMDVDVESELALACLNLTVQNFRITEILPDQSSGRLKK